MARRTTFSGESVTITETKGGDVNKRHWFLVNGTAQGVIDYLNENGIPEHKVKSFFLATTWYAWYHK